MLTVSWLSPWSPSAGEVGSRGSCEMEGAGLSLGVQALLWQLPRAKDHLPQT